LSDVVVYRHVNLCSTIDHWLMDKEDDRSKRRREQSGKREARTRKQGTELVA
jgi:hypothetical protein